MSSRTFRSRHTESRIDASLDGSTLRLHTDRGEGTWEAKRLGRAEFSVSAPGGDRRQHTVFAVRNGRDWWLHVDGRTYLLEEVLGQAVTESPGALTAPIPGTVTEVMVAVGDAVEAGQVVMVITAMKMQLEIKATHGGIVRGLDLTVGDPVDGGRELLRIEPLDS